MLLNHSRALAKMEAAGLDALVAAVPRNVYYASGFWNRNLEWGSQEAQAAVILPRDPAIAPMLVVPEFAISGLLETPTWIPRLRVTDALHSVVSAGLGANVVDVCRRDKVPLAGLLHVQALNVV